MQPLPPERATVTLRHVHRHPCFVDAHQAVGIEVKLLRELGPAMAQDVGPLLLGRLEKFFARDPVPV